MDAYGRGGRRRRARRPARLLRTRVHELGWDRPARDAARAGEPRNAAAARVRAERPLPPDLRAHAARRGDRDLRERGRGAGRGLRLGSGGAMDRAEHVARRRQLGEAGRPLAASNVPQGLSTRSAGSRSSPRSRASGRCGRRRTGSRWPSSTSRRRRLIAVWKAEFPTFWPKGSQFHAPLTGIAPGEVALLQASLGGGLKLSTGILVLYADEESFTFMTPQGHMFAGWITFSARRAGRRDRRAVRRC